MRQKRNIESNLIHRAEIENKNGQVRIVDIPVKIKDKELSTGFGCSPEKGSIGGAGTISIQLSKARLVVKKVFMDKLTFCLSNIGVSPIVSNYSHR